jgi:glycosyltransferase involved in cell wall biosynthesis
MNAHDALRHAIDASSRVPISSPRLAEAHVPVGDSEGILEDPPVDHPLKVLLVAADVNTIGGIQQYNRNVKAGIEESGAEVRLIELKGLSYASKTDFVLRILGHALFWRPDVIWCAHINFSPVMFLLKRVLTRPYLVALYGIDVLDINGRLHARALRAADLLTPIAHHTAANLLAQIPEVRDRLFLIPNSVDGARFGIREKPQRLTERHGLEGAKIILTVARLNPAEHKGYDRVIDALPLVIDKVPEAKYLLVGGGDDPRVRQAIERHGLHDRVVLAGAASAEDLVDYYNLCDVYAMPSKFEGFAIVFLEALACGRPVVASDGYGCKEALLNGDLGITVDPDSRSEIAAALVRLLNDPPAHLANRASLRQRTLASYDLSAFKKRVGEAVRLAAGAKTARDNP